MSLWPGERMSWLLPPTYAATAMCSVFRRRAETARPANSPRPRFGIRACQALMRAFDEPCPPEDRADNPSLAITDAPGRQYRIPDLIFNPITCILIVRLGGGVMSNCRALVVALVLVVPGVALAKSGYVRPPEPKLVHASMPNISSSVQPHRVVHHCRPRHPC